MTAHTPGPWHIQVRKEGWDIHEPISAGGFKIAHANTELNARLIAAAPQLLEALSLLLACEANHEIQDVKEQLFFLAPEIKCHADAAIAAAEPKPTIPCTCRKNGCFVPHDECICGCLRAIAAAGEQP